MEPTVSYFWYNSQCSPRCALDLGVLYIIDHRVTVASRPLPSVLSVRVRRLSFIPVHYFLWFETHPAHTRVLLSCASQFPLPPRCPTQHSPFAQTRRTPICCGHIPSQTHRHSPQCPSDALKWTRSSRNDGEPILDANTSKFARALA